MPGLIRSPRGDQWEPASLAGVPVCPHPPFITWPVTTCAQQALGTTHVSLSPPSRQALPAGRSTNSGQMPRRTKNVSVAKDRLLPPYLRCSPPALPFAGTPGRLPRGSSRSLHYEMPGGGPLVCVIPAGHALKPIYQARCSPKISSLLYVKCVWGNNVVHEHTSHSSNIKALK